MLLYFQFKSLEVKTYTFQVVSWFALILGTLLVVPNMYCVYLMWRHSLNKAKVSYSARTIQHSFFAGLVTGLLTPNMMGNFIGRIYYFEPKHHTVLIGLTLYSNHAHFVTSLIFGGCALFFVDLGQMQEFIDFALVPSIVLVTLGVGIYFFPEFIIPSKWTKWRINELRETLKVNRSLSLTFMGYTAIRFLVFSSQFFLVLVALGVAPSWQLFIYIWFIYFLTLMAPSLVLGKLGVKEAIAVFVLSQVGIEPVIVLIASLYIWLLNTFSPALLGLIITKDRNRN